MRLKNEALPLLKDQAAAPGQAMRAAIASVLDIMGAEWQPPAEYLDAIGNLLA